MTVVLIGVLILAILIGWFRMDSFLAFLVVSVGIGLILGMPMQEVAQSVQKGIGDTLGFLVIILGIGAMLGKIVAESGAAQRISQTLVHTFPEKYVRWAVLLTGFIVGIPMFYAVGFVILVPLVFAVAATTRLPLLYVGLPMLAALSVTHGYLPPHPAPTAIASMYGADLTKTLVYGLIVAIPAIIIGGPVFASTLKKYNPQPLKSLIVQKEFSEDEMPGIWNSVLSALSPVLLLLLGGLPEVVSMPGRFLPALFSIFKEPAIAMLIAILLVTFTLGVRRGRSFSELTSIYHEAVKSVAVVLLIIAGAGAFKEVLVSAGINEEIGLILADLEISPIILAWGIAGVIRICVGSATVAGLTAAGIMLPVIATSGINPSLMVLATGAGSLLFSHVNDGGFWLFKEFFNMSLVDTFKTWTVMETIVSVTGLLGVLALSVFV